MTQPDLSEIHQRLAYAREQRGFATASDAARRFRWNENTYRSHENGERGLKIDVAYKYAKAFNIKLDWLLVGDSKYTQNTQQGRLLTGRVNDDGEINYYPDHNVGKFSPILAFSEYFSEHEHPLFEFDTTRPFLNCWPGDLIITARYSKVIRTTRLHPGAIAVVTLDDERVIVRSARFNEDRSQIDIQLYPEMGPIYRAYNDISLVHCIIKRGGWGYSTLDSYEEQLNDPWKKISGIEPPRQP